MVRKKCRCGKREREIQCYKEFQCDVKCAKLRDCAVHQCKRKVYLLLSVYVCHFVFFWVIFLAFLVYFLLVVGSMVVITSATDCLESLISRVNRYVLSWMLNFLFSCAHMLSLFCLYCSISNTVAVILTY